MALTATSFLNKVGMKYCDESFRCKATYPPGQTVFTQDFGATPADCYVGADNFYQPSAVEQSIVAGRVTYSEASASACIAGIMYPASCTNFWTTDPTYPAACDTALVGKVADGAACVSIFDCSNVNSVCDATTKTCKVQP
jgi:hypothetical protein